MFLPEREYSLEESFNSILNIFNIHRWTVSNEYNPLGFGNQLDVATEIQNDESRLLKSYTESRGKGKGLESLCSANYELLEHIIYENPQLQSFELSDTQNDEKIEGDIVIEIQNYLPKFKNIRFSKLGAQSIFGYLPGYYCGFSTSDDVNNPYARLIECYYSNNGWAAGANYYEALLHALNELLERDSVSNAYISIINNKEFGCEYQNLSPELSKLKESIEQRKHHDVHLIHLDSLAGHSFIAFCENNFGYKTIGCGSSLYPEYAARRALSELWQELVADSLTNSAEEKLRKKRLEHILTNYPNLSKAIKLEGNFSSSKEELFSTCTQNRAPKEQVEKIINDLSTKSIDCWARTIFSEQSENCIPTVVQVVAPGLERFHRIHDGLIVEPIGRLRTHTNINLARKKYNS
ncbi:YcaO-like family protein [Alloscardovia omnicolens]|uniref:YcaO-like family protein n=1 Tax=Alloscardovia omnicolens TaxID=419015 RepID=UPI00254CA8F2|nr:YcaO-like family protein [Alloscardovia omnicolens]MDK6444729.1 YcaO-like family protein [Alloscardovia omnicolens]